MALHDADLETNLFFVRDKLVYRRGLVEARETDNQLTGAELPEEYVAEASDFIEGAAEQIANALNRLPQAEALLLTVAGAIRNGEATRLHKLADEIEEWMVNG